MTPDPVMGRATVGRGPFSADFQGEDNKFNPVVADGLFDLDGIRRFVSDEPREVCLSPQGAENFMAGQCRFESGEGGAVIGEFAGKMGGEQERAGHDFVSIGSG
jgi:hypothetical protein